MKRHTERKAVTCVAGFEDSARGKPRMTCMIFFFLRPASHQLALSRSLSSGEPDLIFLIPRRQNLEQHGAVFWRAFLGSFEHFSTALDGGGGGSGGQAFPISPRTNSRSWAEARRHPSLFGAAEAAVAAAASLRYQLRYFVSQHTITYHY